jgi:hypothetical protein
MNYTRRANVNNDPYDDYSYDSNAFRFMQVECAISTST